MSQATPTLSDPRVNRAHERTGMARFRPQLALNRTTDHHRCPQTLEIVAELHAAVEKVVVPARLTPFVSWVWAALVAATIVVPGRSVHAQALEPRSYANTPVGINFLLLGYGYSEGSVAVDSSVPIKDTKVVVHDGLLAYARSLDVWGLSGKFAAALPFAEASGSAKLSGQGRERQVFGLADPLLRFSVNV
jgi:hypothetical protein